MPNEKNLKKGKATQFKSGEEAAKNGKKGGEASVQSRREKKTIQQILNTVLDGDISTLPQFASIAKKLGVERDKSIKELFSLICLLNSVKTANLSDLEHLVKLLGEDKQDENTDVLKKLDDVLDKIDGNI